MNDGFIYSDFPHKVSTISFKYVLYTSAFPAAAVSHSSLRKELADFLEVLKAPLSLRFSSMIDSSEIWRFVFFSPITACSFFKLSEDMQLASFATISSTFSIGNSC